MVEKAPHIGRNEKPRNGPVMYLVRHGRTQYAEDNKNNHLAVDAEDPLNSAGEAQSVATGERIANEVEPDEEVIVIASPFQRAQDAAHLIVKTLKKRGVRVATRGLLARGAEMLDKALWHGSARRTGPHFRMARQRDADRRKHIEEDSRLGKTRLFSWEHVLPFIYDDSNAQPLGFFDPVTKKEYTAKINIEVTNPQSLNHKEFFSHNGLGKLMQGRRMEDTIMYKVLLDALWPKGVIKRFMAEVKQYETFAETTTRMINVLHDLNARYAGKKVRIVVVTHRALLNFLSEYFSDGSLPSVEPGGFIKLESRGAKGERGSLVVTAVGDRPVAKDETVFDAEARSSDKLQRGDDIA